jgi:hypothetical protein
MEKTIFTTKGHEGKNKKIKARNNKQTKTINKENIK